MTSHRITAVRKPDRYSQLEHITDVEYDDVVHSRASVIRRIENGTDSFYVLGGGYKTAVQVVYPGSLRDPYIRTHADATGKDNLLSLPEC